MPRDHPGDCWFDQALPELTLTTEEEKMADLTINELNDVLDRAAKQGLLVEYCETHSTDSWTGAYAEQYSEDEMTVLEQGNDPCIVVIRVPKRHWDTDADDWLDL